MPFSGLLTVGLISAGAQIFGAHQASSAAHDAADQQTAAANQARADLRPLYEANVARMDPYAQLGAQAVGQLRSLSGFGAPPAIQPGGSAAPQQVAVPLSPNGNQNTVNPPMDMSNPQVQHLAQGGGFENMPGRSSLSNLGTGGGQSSYGAPSGAPGSGVMAPQGGATVKMRSPDGSEEQDVPEQFAAMFEQHGARRVG